jgi:hypothetical protein
MVPVFSRKSGEKKPVMHATAAGILKSAFNVPRRMTLFAHTSTMSTADYL